MLIRQLAGFRVTSYSEPRTLSPPPPGDSRVPHHELLRAPDPQPWVPLTPDRAPPGPPSCGAAAGVRLVIAGAPQLVPEGNPSVPSHVHRPPGNPSVPTHMAHIVASRTARAERSAWPFRVQSDPMLLTPSPHPSLAIAGLPSRAAGLQYAASSARALAIASLPSKAAGLRCFKRALTPLGQKRWTMWRCSLVRAASAHGGSYACSADVAADRGGAVARSRLQTPKRAPSPRPRTWAETATGRQA